MKKLGLIGGVGPESTVPYYKGIVFGVKDRVGHDFFPRITIESMSCFDVVPMSVAGKKQELVDYFLDGIKSLAAAGCDFAALSCYTGHMVFEELEKVSPIPLVLSASSKRRSMKRRSAATSGFCSSAPRRRWRMGSSRNRSFGMGLTW